MNSFFTGQVVVCINPDPDGLWFHNGNRSLYPGPRMKEMCVIRGIDSSGKGLLIVGHHTDSTYSQDGTEAGYHYNGFRPLVAYKNDISVFKALLVPVVPAEQAPVHRLPAPHTSQP